ncbi:MULTISPECIES: hypothetical protein [unclassified Sinorhizobium]|uniref:hypothetical protein n=1 Tax=unclassified Sinorhizobium TaxID=2613772 RepID=UPI003524FC57
MKTIVFNSCKPVVTNLGDTAEVGDWPADDWKYADVHHVYPRTTDLVRKIIDTAPITGRFRRVLIDVKVQDLTPDIYSCIPGWHLDGAFPDEAEEPDNHHLFVMNGPMTEFIDEPVKCEIGEPVDMKSILQQIPLDVKVTTCAPNAITTFTSFDFHRGVKADKPTRRLLVRLTETNTVLAYNKPKAPSMGARAIGV